jgi:hypothetical protein
MHNIRWVTFLVFALVCIPPVTSRLVVTFFDANPCDRVSVLPNCAQMAKCYGHRMVMEVDTCGVSPSDLSGWVQTIFGEGTVQAVETDDLVLASEDMTPEPMVHAAGAEPTPEPMVHAAGAEATPEPMVHAAGAEATPEPMVQAAGVSQPWMISNEYGIGVEDMWDLTNGNSDTVVAMLDSGIAPMAIPLFRHLAVGYDFVSDESISQDGDGRDAIWEDPGDSSANCPGDSSWHGTKMAAVVAGNHDLFEYGIAKDITLLPVRVLGACKSGYASDVADAIVWASGNTINGVESNMRPATIISMSLSGPGACPSYLQSAVTLAISSGSIVLAAAGNNGASGTNYFPGNCVGVISVAATTNSRVLASYSNRHATIAAPGGDAQNPIGTMSVGETGLVLTTVTGTSVAVAVLAGFLALALDLYGPAFNLGGTLVPFADSCTIAQCGAGIIAYNGTVYAKLVVSKTDTTQSYYQCSPNANMATNLDQVATLNRQTSEWTMQEQPCMVTAATIDPDTMPPLRYCPGAYCIELVICGTQRDSTQRLTDIIYYGSWSRTNLPPA